MGQSLAAGGMIIINYIIIVIIIIIIIMISSSSLSLFIMMIAPAGLSKSSAKRLAQPFAAGSVSEPTAGSVSEIIGHPDTGHGRL